MYGLSLYRLLSFSVNVKLLGKKVGVGGGIDISKETSRVFEKHYRFFSIVDDVVWVS